MTGSIYGYVRVSTREQNEDRQLIALREVGVSDKNIFMDKNEKRRPALYQEHRSSGTQL